MSTLRVLVLPGGALLALPTAVFAGMPQPVVIFNEMARMRLENLSFFLMGFLLCSWLIQLLWNGMRRDFPALPRLSYWRAVGVVSLWGLLFILVLTMISGARELMTPGAWESDGATYRLAAKELPGTDDPEYPRRRQLVKLKAALWSYAKRHEGRLPEQQSDSAIPQQLWVMPHPSRARYLYRGGKVSSYDPVPVVIEPEVDEERWVLFSDGDIRRLPAAQFTRALEKGRE